MATVHINNYIISADYLQVLLENACRNLADMLLSSSVEVVRQSSSGHETRGGPGAEQWDRAVDVCPLGAVQAK